MRAPLSAIEPASRGVSILTRGDCARVCSRVCAGVAPGWPGACGAPGGVWVGAGGAVVPGGVCGAGWPGTCCCWRRRLLLLLVHLRQADKNLPANQDQRRQHDGEERVLLVVHLMARIARGLRWTGRRSPRHILGGGHLQPPHRAVEFLDQPIEWQLQRRAASDEDVIIARAHPPGGRARNHRLEAPAHAVAVDRASHLLGDGETDSDRTTVASRLGPATRRPRSAPWLRSRWPRNRPVASAAPWACPARRAGSRRQALSRLRPWARRLAMILRPPLVAIRAR